MTFTGIHNNDPEWRRITDYNFNDYPRGNPDWLVKEWRDFHTKSLELLLPHDDELMRRWWRFTFVAFVQRTLVKNGMPKHHFKQLSSEEHLLNSVYPWMKPLWRAKQYQLSAFVPSYAALRKRWWMGKRHDFYCRYMGGRKTYNERNHIRMDVVLSRFLWCRHGKCWILRLNIFIVAIIILTLLYVLLG